MTEYYVTAREACGACKDGVRRDYSTAYTSVTCPHCDGLGYIDRLVPLSEALAAMEKPTCIEHNWQTFGPNELIADDPITVCFVCGAVQLSKFYQL